MALGPWRALPRPAFGPRGALKRFGPAPPRRSTPLNKKTRVKAPQKLRPAVAALAFFSLRLPCLVLRLVRLRSLAALLGRVPPAGARLSPLAVLTASPAFALRAPSRLSAAGLSLGRYRSRRSLCVYAAPPLFGRCPFAVGSVNSRPVSGWQISQRIHKRSRLNKTGFARPCLLFSL